MQQQATSMFLVRFPAGLSPVQVDDFPPKTPRSCEGALHIRPDSTKKITPHEAAHLTAKGIPFQKVKKVAPLPPVSAAAAPALAPVPAPPAPAPASAKPMRRRSESKEDGSPD